MHTSANGNSSNARILCATDFSASAAAAAARAARLAQASGCELELMHVVPPRKGSPYRICEWEADRRDVAPEAMARLRAMASDIEARFAVPVGMHLAFGVAHAQIAARADATDARLVVVGPHGERPVRDMFVGSTARQLGRVLRAPLLIARRRSTRAYERVLIAVDFSPASAGAARAAARLFPDAALHFLHVCNTLFESRVALADGRKDALRVYRNQALLQAGRELDGFIRDNGLQHRRASSLVTSGYLPACISQAAAELEASVVAFGANARSHLDTALLGSLTGQFMSGVGQDVLLSKAARGRPQVRLREEARESGTT